MARHGGAVLFLLVVLLNGGPYNGLAAREFTNPIVFKIGGVFSKEESKDHFKNTIDVSGFPQLPK